MRRDYKLIVWLLTGIFSFLVCCASNKAGHELVSYVNQGILGIADLERVSLEHYASVTGKNYTTDQRVYDALKDQVIPVYKRFLDGLRDITPQDEAVKKLHGIYIKGAELLYNGFKLKMLGIEKNDKNLIILSNEKIEKGRVETEKWRKELDALCQQQGVAEEKKVKEYQEKKNKEK